MKNKKIKCKICTQNLDVNGKVNEVYRQLRTNIYNTLFPNIIQYLLSKWDWDIFPQRLNFMIVNSQFELELSILVTCSIHIHHDLTMGTTILAEYSYHTHEHVRCIPSFKQHFKRFLFTCRT